MEVEEVSEGRYLYCIINSGTETSLGAIGIEDSRVYTVACKDISAVVHSCAAKPYDSKDEEKVKEWVLSHQYTIDASTEKFGTVIPLAFDTIVKGDDETVKEWLSENYAELKERLEKVRDKAEFTVQIFWDQELIIPKVEEISEELKKLKEDMKKKSKGAAYMLRRKSEKLLKNALLAEAERYSRDFYEQVKKHVDELRIEATKSARVPKKWQDKQMILNLSCLVHNDKVEELGKELEKINEMEGFSVRFTGPWAPFSFVGEVGK